jgi:hypothetical protein
LGIRQGWCVGFFSHLWGFLFNIGRIGQQRSKRNRYLA